ncbi:MAG: hypothetical protein IT460_08135 [Planctomycetes bacterium]|nr:hypothetical protein [Planctomycetota bacterium]
MRTVSCCAALAVLVLAGCSSSPEPASSYRYSTAPRSVARSSAPLPPPQRRVLASPPPIILPPRPST